MKFLETPPVDPADLIILQSRPPLNALHAYHVLSSLALFTSQRRFHPFDDPSLMGFTGIVVPWG
jgi:hypothetical protein